MSNDAPQSIVAEGRCVIAPLQHQSQMPFGMARLKVHEYYPVMDPFQLPAFVSNHIPFELY